jgi:ribosomal protein S18 acetylase RimI-like enzyme
MAQIIDRTDQPEEIGGISQSNRPIETRIPPRIRIASQEQTPEVADTLAAAFFADPVAMWLVPDDAQRMPLMRAFFQTVLESAWQGGRLIYTAEDIQAASVWILPGRAQLTEEEAGKLMPVLAEIFRDRTSALDVLMSSQDEHHPHEPHYYLPFIGTRPEAQGQGLGSAILRPALARADADGMPAYLEATTERNRALYERYGFAVIGLLEVPDGPTMFKMWRGPR